MSTTSAGQNSDFVKIFASSWDNNGGRRKTTRRGIGPGRLREEKPNELV
jgi:hypothetical protein